MLKKDNNLLLIICASLLIYNSSYAEENYTELLKINRNDAAAVKILQNAVSNNPNSKSAKIVCAKVYMKNGRYKEAENLLMLVLEEDPTNIKANKLLIELNNLVTNNSSNSEGEFHHKIEPIFDENEESFFVKDDENTNTLSIIKNNNISKLDNKTEKLPSTQDIINKAKEKINSENNTSNTLNKKTTNNQQNNNNNLNNISSQNSKVIDLIKNSNSSANKEINITDNKSKNNNNVQNNNEKKVASIAIGNNEKFELKPFIAPDYKKKNSKKTDLFNSTQKDNKVSFTNTNIQSNNSEHQKVQEKNYRQILSDTSKVKFLEATTDSFSINLEEAYSRIERNELDIANYYLNRALAIAANERNTKKLFDVQLTRAVIYMYQCDFVKYGEHILDIRKGLTDSTYQSLHKVYESAINLTDKNLQLKYVANLALKSGHFYTALDLANRIKVKDKETQIIIQKANSMINQINGEYLLNNGSFIYALDYFENKNDEAEKGRTYLAISKSLYESNEPKQAKIAEQFGRSCLLNYIQNRI